MSYPLDYDTVRNLKPEELFSVIDDWINCHPSPCPKAFRDALNSTHRTLQESFVQFFWTALLQYGRSNNSYDDRNEDAVKLCRQLADMVEAGSFPEHLRYI